jgi:Tfp pilus assembly protein PilF
MTAMEQKQWTEAISQLEKASQLEPKETAVWVNLADSYLADSASKTGADKDAETQKGMDAYSKAIELKPDDAAIHNNYGRALANIRKYPEAMAEMNKAATLDPPGAGKYYYNLGAILVNIGQTDPAVEAFQKSIAADPNYADAYYQYGVSLMAKAKIGDDGKVTPAPGTVEAFQKCLSFGDKCTFAQQCNDSIAALGSSVDTQYSDPNAKKAPATTKKKK